MNEPSTNTTFANRIGKSNTDITLTTSNLLRRIFDWKINDEETNSDHSMINCDIIMDTRHQDNTTTMRQKFIVSAASMETYTANIRKIVENKIQNQSTATNEDDLDERLYKIIKQDRDTAKQIEQFNEAMKLACEQSFRTTNTLKALRKHKSVPWWTQELTAMRKTTKALRRKYQKQETM
jgi:hypothetical protein